LHTVVHLSASDMPWDCYTGAALGPIYDMTIKEPVE